MALIDQKGNFLGKVNAIDLFIILVLISTLIGFFWVKAGNSSLTKKVKAEGKALVKIAIRGARVEDMKVFEKYKKAYIIIRNQPFDNVDIVNVKVNRRPLTFYVPEEKKPMKFVNFDDELATDVDMVVSGDAQLTTDDPPSIVMGGNKVKAGIPVELETLEYKFTGSIISVKMPGHLD
ncbi:MAG: DUF4330 domain-containing protein [Candidatus Sericytochromatia bacterium]